MESDDECSLMDFLRKQKLATIVFITINTNSIFSLFKIEIYLADCEQRLSYADDVLEAVSSHLRRLHSQIFDQDGQLERLYGEFVNAEINSEFTEDIPQFNAECMAEDLVCGNSEPKYECDPAAIREAIDVLKRRNFNIMILSDHKYDEDDV